MACGCNGCGSTRGADRRAGRNAQYWNGYVWYDVEMRYWGPFFESNNNGQVGGIGDDENCRRCNRCCGCRCGCGCGCGCR